MFTEIPVDLPLHHVEYETFGYIEWYVRKSARVVMAEEATGRV